MVRALMCLELILNAVNINLVTFSDFFDIISDLILVYPAEINTLKIVPFPTSLSTKIFPLSLWAIFLITVFCCSDK